MTERLDERRRSARLQAEQVFAAFTVQGLSGSNQGFGVVRNVSENGVSLDTPQPPAVPSTVTLRIGVGEELFELSMQVRRVQPDSGGGHIVGMDFLKIDEQRERFLARFLEDGRSPDA